MTDEYTASGHHKDYARQIRNEMNRDAMPTPEEAERMHRDHLASEGCHECGEDDPDNLQMEMPYVHNCPAYQAPDPEPRVVCAEHHAPAKQRFIERKKAQGRTFVLYECGITVHPESAEPATEGRPHPAPPYANRSPTVAITCRCGAHIEDVFYLDDE